MAISLSQIINLDLQVINKLNMPFWVEQILERVATYGYDAYPKPIREVYVFSATMSVL